MPKMNGFEVIREIRGSEHFDKIPVVMMTSSQEQERLLKGIREWRKQLCSETIEFSGIY